MSMQRGLHVQQRQQPPCPYRDPIVNDACLTELGQSQAADNRVYSIAKGALETVFVSPLTRAVETALAFAGAANEGTVPSFRENLRAVWHLRMRPQKVPHCHL